MVVTSLASAVEPGRTQRVALTADVIRIGNPALLRVGPSRQIKTLADAARLAPDGAVIEVDAGTYRHDVAVWTQRDLVVRAVGGRVRLIADGAAAEAKAIWVVRSPRMTVDGFDFEGATVPDRNGAGIRFEHGHLLIRDCVFRDNQSGILGGNDADAVLEIEDSEFVSLRPEDGQNHHLYVGRIGRLSVSGSYFHRGAIGHLLKSRAAVNLIYYNRLTDEDGTASYELEFPNGGLAVVVANIIQQSPRTENPHIIAYGAEGYAWAVNEIHLVNNTVVDDMPGGGVFLRAQPGAGRVRAVNNLWVGKGEVPAAGRSAELENNFAVGRASIDPSTAGAYRLRPTSAAWGRAIAPGSAHGEELAAKREFRLPRGSTPLSSPAMNPGALQAPGAVARPTR